MSFQLETSSPVPNEREMKVEHPVYIKLIHLNEKLKIKTSELYHLFRDNLIYIKIERISETQHM